MQRVAVTPCDRRPASRRVGRAFLVLGLAPASLGGIAALGPGASLAADRSSPPPRPAGVGDATHASTGSGWARRADGTWVEHHADRAPSRIPAGVVPTALPDEDDEPLPSADDVLPSADDVLPPAGAPDPTPPAMAAPLDTPPGPGAAVPSDEAGSIDYADLPAAERPLIVRIDIVGARLYTVDTIETRMRNKVGRRFDPVALEADLAELRRFFAEIQVVREAVPGGIVLRFLVAENPLVERLVIRGNAEMDLEEIQPLLRTREGYPLSPIHLEADRDDIVAAYRARGFRFADVPAPRITTLPTGGRRVDITIVEGPRVEVSKVSFRGNRHLDRDALLEVMQLDEPALLQRVFDPVIFREELLREDLIAIREVYRDAGFLDAEAAVEDLRYSDDKSKVEITIAIDEGRPYAVGTVTVVFERVEPGAIGAPTAEDLAVFTEDRVRSMLGLVPGSRYDGKAARDGIQEIREAYLQRSFHDVSIPPPTRRGRIEGGVVDVELKVNEGPKFRLSRIDFVGNEFTRDNILRREVETAPGGYVDGTELERGQARLRRLNYFQRAELRLLDSIGPDGEPIPGWKTATYQIVESSTGQVNVGFQVDPTGSQGLGAFINLKKRNFDITRWPTSLEDLRSGRAFTGAGQTFDIMLAPSTEETMFSVRFVEPRVFGSRFGFSASVFRQISFREDHDIDIYGYTFGLSYPIVRDRDGLRALVGEVAWTHRWVDLKDIGPFAVPGVFLFANKHEYRSATASLRYLETDSVIDPRVETSTTLSAELAGGDLGGDIDMTRVRLGHSRTQTLHVDADGGKHRVHFASHFTVMEAFGDTPEVPPYERETLGGRTLRGFEYRGVGPRVNGRPTGGEVAWRASLEYEIPISADTLAGVLFVDAGAVEPTFDDLDLDDTRVGVGFGIRLKIPILGDRPFAIDFGWAVRSKDDDRDQLVSFSFGRTF